MTNFIVEHPYLTALLLVIVITLWVLSFGSNKDSTDYLDEEPEEPVKPQYKAVVYMGWDNEKITYDVIDYSDMSEHYLLELAGEKEVRVPVARTIIYDI